VLDFKHPTRMFAVLVQPTYKHTYSLSLTVTQKIQEG